MKILLCEDDEICQGPIKTFSKRFGLELDVANNGKEGVDFASKNYYDLILMDIYMPEMNGYEATESIRNLPEGSKFKIVALSGDICTEETLKKHGFDDFVKKPVSKSNFEALINKYKI